MAYIAYLDLLGTKDFCNEKGIYKTNIDKFYKAVDLCSHIIGDKGRIGLFSDCMYIECFNLEWMLDFLTELRRLLIADNLFFNAALAAGELGPVTTHKKTPHIDAVKFSDERITDIYCKQTLYRGIGIWLYDFPEALLL